MQFGNKVSTTTR